MNEVALRRPVAWGASRAPFAMITIRVRTSHPVRQPGFVMANDERLHHLRTQVVVSYVHTLYACGRADRQTDANLCPTLLEVFVHR